MYLNYVYLQKAGESYQTKCHWSIIHTVFMYGPQQAIWLIYS